MSLSRRSLLQLSGTALSAHALGLHAFAEPPAPETHLNLNENAFGPSPRVAPAIQRELASLSRYADATAAQAFAEQVAAYERVPVEQIILGEILGALGLYLGSIGGPGGEFVYSTPGYLALVDAASHVGGVGVPVPLNSRFENDLPALLNRIDGKTRALYLINPHNPTGTVNDDAEFKRFLRSASQHAPVIVDEAYLEYTPDFSSRSAVDLVRDGANVLVFRTFDKIHGLAGLPIGYTVAPRGIAQALRAQGLGDAESLGRLNIAAARAALEDRAYIAHVRSTVQQEREKWTTLLDSLALEHSHSAANFVFFNTGRPHDQIAAGFAKQGIRIARAFPPFSTWVRITIGTAAENLRAQRALRNLLHATDASA